MSEGREDSLSQNCSTFQINLTIYLALFPAFGMSMYVEHREHNNLVLSKGEIHRVRKSAEQAAVKTLFNLGELPRHRYDTREQVIELC